MNPETLQKKTKPAAVNPAAPPALQAKKADANAHIVGGAPYPGIVQGKGEVDGDAVHARAAEGLRGGAGTLPYLGQIQASFGQYDISNVQAHVGGPAAQASASIGAEAYATGNHVAFRTAPTLHTAAHEAAHVVQQRGGIQLKGGVGEVGDPHERHADRVADAVVAGRSATGLLSEYGKGGTGGGQTQRQVQGFWWLFGNKPKAEEKTPTTDTSAFADDKKKVKVLETATKDALKMVKNALKNIAKGNSTYMTYMDGAATSKSTEADVDTRMAHVKTGFEAVKKALEDDEIVFKKWDLPEDNKIKEENTYAYVRPSEADHNIYMGGVFWVAKNKGIDSKPGVIIHELTHRVHATVDHHYGVTKSKESAAGDPAKSTTNADNYEHFAEKS